jgi:hypothetical protein
MNNTLDMCEAWMETPKNFMGEWCRKLQTYRTDVKHGAAGGVAPLGAAEPLRWPKWLQAGAMFTRCILMDTGKGAFVEYIVEHTNTGSRSHYCIWLSPKQQFTIPGGTEAIRYLRKIEKVLQNSENLSP